LSFPLADTVTRRATPDPVARLRALDDCRRQAHARLERGASLAELSDAQLFALDDGTRKLDALIEVMGEEAKARTDERFDHGLPL